MLWIGILLPRLPLECLWQESKAAAVFERHKLVCINAEAETAGLEPGMNTGTARALCPDLRLIERIETREQLALRQLAEQLLEFTPHVVMASANELVLEISGCLVLFKGLDRLLTTLQQRLQENRWTQQLALGPTPKAARLLASTFPLHAPWPAQAPEPLKTQQWLHKIPVTQLPLEPKLIHALQRPGFMHLGDIMALPAPAIRRRFGKAFTTFLAQILGEHPDPQTPVQAPEDFRQEMLFMDGISHSEGLLFPLQRLANELCHFLRHRQIGCRRFDIELEHLNHSHSSITIHCASPEPHPERYLRLIRLRLDTLKIESPVETVRLCTKEFSAPKRHSEWLFEELAQEGHHTQAAQDLLDVLRARIGNDNCLHLHPVNAHLPEQAQTLDNLVHTAANDALPSAPRPFWLLPQPAPLHWQQKKLCWKKPLQILSEAERICTPWWEDITETRDYFIARQDDGQTLWIYRVKAAAPEHSDHWFVQGIF